MFFFFFLNLVPYDKGLVHVSLLHVNGHVVLGTLICVILVDTDNHILLGVRMC